jgi:ubiquinone/menaquinone biosynthesis C-methylase UbiE
MKQLATMILACILCPGIGVLGAEEWADLFDNPEKKEWQNPGLVTRLMGIEKGQKTAAIGSDCGLFLRYLSNMVGESGEVYFVTGDKGVLEYFRGLDGFSRYDNISGLLAATGEIVLPERKLDQILLVNTLSVVPERRAYLEKLARALKPTGRLTVVDWHSGGGESAPPEPDRLGRETVVEEFTNAGWILVTESIALPHQYLLLFSPPAAK